MALRSAEQGRFVQAVDIPLAPARKSAQIISRQSPRDLSEPSIRLAVSRGCSITARWLFGKLM
jgi:hypothetical protein